VGVGAHFCDLDYRTNVSDLSNNDSAFSYSVAGGFHLDFLNRFAFRAGPTLYYFYIDDFAGKAVNMVEVGGIAGITVSF
jgi:hypothetical protein